MLIFHLGSTVSFNQTEYNVTEGARYVELIISLSKPVPCNASLNLTEYIDNGEMDKHIANREL